MKIGDAIKESRKSKGLTQKQLAEKIGVNTVTVTRYENNDREPNFETLKKIAIELGISLNDLFDNETKSIVNTLFNNDIESFLYNSMDEDIAKTRKEEMIIKFSGLNTPPAETIIFFDLLYYVAVHKCDIPLGTIFNLFDKMHPENFNIIKNSIIMLIVGHITQLNKEGE